MKKGLILLTAILLLAGCGKEKAETTSWDTQGAEVTQAVDVTQAGQESSDNGTGKDAASGNTTEGFAFEANGVTIPMNVDVAPIIEALGEPVQYFEAASCAFQGLDKIYTYSGFEINTYPKDGKDFISSVYFLDDSVATDKGIYLGSTLEEVTAAYGEDFTQESGEYTYTLGQTSLSFILEEDAVASITYSAIVDGLNNLID